MVKSADGGHGAAVVGAAVVLVAADPSVIVTLDHVDLLRGRAVADSAGPKVLIFCATFEARRRPSCRGPSTCTAGVVPSCWAPVSLTTRKNCEPVVPGAARSPSPPSPPCSRRVGRLVGQVYPGPPRAVPVGSPPWSTKSVTIRWKSGAVVEALLPARYTKLLTVCGAAWRRARSSTSPPLVCRTAVYCFVGVDRHRRRWRQGRWSSASAAPWSSIRLGRRGRRCCCCRRCW